MGCSRLAASSIRKASPVPIGEHKTITSASTEFASGSATTRYPAAVSQRGTAVRTRLVAPCTTTARSRWCVVRAGCWVPACCFFPTHELRSIPSSIERSFLGRYWSRVGPQASDVKRRGKRVQDALPDDLRRLATTARAASVSFVGPRPRSITRRPPRPSSRETPDPFVPR